MSSAITKPKVIEGWVGVINGRPVFGSTSDEHGDFQAFDVFKTAPKLLSAGLGLRM